MSRQRDRNRERTRETGKKKNKGFKAGAIAFGVTAVLYAAIFPLYRISDFLLCGALSMLVGKIISIMGSGLDLTTHNRQDAREQPAPPEELPLSGNEAADAVIARGQEMLHQIRAENDAIPDQVLSGQMDELERLCIGILQAYYYLAPETQSITLTDGVRTADGYTCTLGAPAYEDAPAVTAKVRLMQLDKQLWYAIVLTPEGADGAAVLQAFDNLTLR